MCIRDRYRSFTSLVRFILRYRIHLGAIVNRIDSLVSLSSVSVYRNATDFWALILYLATLPNCCMSPSNFGVESFGFSVYSVMSSVKREYLILLCQLELLLFLLVV